MGPVIDPVASTEDLPNSVDVAVIGGGIVGVMTALTLAERGQSVALFEKGMIAGEQSSRNWGWVRQTGRDLRELPLIEASLRRWGDMNRRVGAETGFRVSGIAYASRSEDALVRHARWRDHAAEHGIRSRILSSSQFSDALPGLAAAMPGALYTESDGRAEPQKAVPAMARAASALGATIHQGVAVRSVERAGGRVESVVTERGRVRCRTVVVAGGAWSRLLLKGLGLTLPQLKVRSNVVRTAPSNYPLTAAVSLGRFAIRKRLDGGFTIATSSSNQADLVPDTFAFGPSFLPAWWNERTSLKLRLNRRFVEEALRWKPGEAERTSIYEAVRVLDPEPDRKTLSRMLEDLSTAVPALAGVEVAQSWAGMIDVMPDAIPVISAVDEVGGLFVGTGFSAHGFGIGPGAGELLADLVMGNEPIVDPHPFRFSRFTDGERIRAQHWL